MTGAMQNVKTGMKRFTDTLLTLIATAFLAAAAPNPDLYSVRDFGAKGDGQTDDTAAFQKALDAAAEAGGGMVYAPRGNYFFAGHLNVPAAVTLRGIWESVPSHNGLRDRGSAKPTDDGTTFLVTEEPGARPGRPSSRSTPTARSRASCSITRSRTRTTCPSPIPTPSPCAAKTRRCSTWNCSTPTTGSTPRHNERHLIRNVQGQPLRRGVFVDAIYDIGRIENVHFNPWWSNRPKLMPWQMANGEAFILARSDWQYMLNTFCFGYNVGYKFIQSRAGVVQRQLPGHGRRRLLHAPSWSSNCAPFGLLITNGEFVSFHGPDPTMVEVGTRPYGQRAVCELRLLGAVPPDRQDRRTRTVGFSDCTFVQWDPKGEGRHAVQARAARCWCGAASSGRTNPSSSWVKGCGKRPSRTTSSVANRA